MVEKYKLYSRTLFTIFWILSCSGVVYQMLPVPDGIQTAVLLLCDFFMILLGITLMRNTGDIFFFAAFCAIIVISTIFINHLRLMDLVNGSRDFIGLLFAVPVIRWFFMSDRRDEFIASFDRQLKIWLYLQAVVAPVQFMVYSDFDEVGGTMGMGASGFLSMMLYLVSFYFIRKNWDSSHYFRSLVANIRYVILLYPSFLNETKASFIYIVLYFVLLIKFDKALLIKALYIIPVSIVALVLLFNVYCDITNQEAGEVFSWNFVEQYMFTGDEGLDFTIEMAQRLQDGEFDDNFDETYWWTVDVPRYAKFAILYPIMSNSPAKLFFGMGVGHYKGTRLMTPTAFARDYEWAIQGSRVWTYTVFMQLGLLGLIWNILYLVRIYRGRVYGPLARQMRFFIGCCIVFVFIYNELFRMPNICVMLFFMLFVLHVNTGQEKINTQTRI